MVAILFASNIMAQNVPSYVPKNGLIGWWPFNGNANDESGNGNNLTNNGPQISTDRFGANNSCYNFNGKSDYLSREAFIGLTDCSISIWVNMSNLPSTNMGSEFFSNGYGCCNGFGLKSENNISNKITVITYGHNGNATNSSFEPKLNTWYNLILTKTSNSYKLYLNGILKSSGVANTNATLGIFGIGAVKGSSSSNGMSNFFNGQLDDIALYNRSLTEQEIKQLYEGCTKESATSSSFNSVVYTTNTPVNLSATPTGGTFNGVAVANNAFIPSKAKLGKNQVKYNFKNSTGCADSTNFTMILVDTLGNKCSTYDTILKINFKLTTGIKAGQLTSMNVYPNPASELLIIEANDIQALGGYRYKIIDLQGKEVYNALVTSARTEISLKTIGTKGMYILHIVDEKGVSIENKKIVLE